jgi:uncharacterized membrane protein
MSRLTKLHAYHWRTINIMADLPTGFWGGWIVVLTLVGLITLAWLVFSIYFSADAKKGARSRTGLG